MLFCSPDQETGINRRLEPAEVAAMIKKHFNLQSLGCTEMMNRVKLEEVREDEITQLYDMQIQSFMPLYEKYHDEGSPAIESVDKVRARLLQDNRKYYFIVKDGARAGAINVGRKLSDPESCLYISPLFILPKYQNQGIGYAAIQKTFLLYPNNKVWKLDTILQEPGNCHLYEKCGFVRVGEDHVINDAMTLINYEKR
jgi:GNAT superfamily N-acetyltransferase